MDAPLIRTELPGPRSRELLNLQSVLETSSRTYSTFFPVAVEKGLNATIKDVDGNLFIDWFAGVCVIALGHNNPRVVEAVKKQLESITHINELPTQARIEFLKQLNSTLPAGLKDHAKTMFTVTGADACEAAVSLARHITKRRTIVAFGGAYHGIHGGIASATASYHYREYTGYGAPGFYHLPYPYPYRFPISVREGDEGKIVVDMLKHIVRDPYSGVDPVAGVLVEPIQGEGGYIVPPPDFLRMLREFTEEEGIPLIVDEVQTGLGRTGTVWASDGYGVTPDIMCVSKAIGGGIPVSLITYREEYDSNLPPGFHLGTYRGNPLALAAGNEILKELRETDILTRVRRKGEQIKSHLEEIADSCPIIGDVRGRGFMIGVELVKGNKAPATEDARRIRSLLFNRGVLMHTCGHYSNVMRFMAPLTIEDELIERGLEIFRQAVSLK
jgi:2,4-diaminobutyrate 4-transaminase